RATAPMNRAEIPRRRAFHLVRRLPSDHLRHTRTRHDQTLVREGDEEAVELVCGDVGGHMKWAYWPTGQLAIWPEREGTRSAPVRPAQANTRVFSGQLASWPVDQLAVVITLSPSAEPAPTARSHRAAGS